MDEKVYETMRISPEELLELGFKKSEKEDEAYYYDFPNSVYNYIMVNLRYNIETVRLNQIDFNEKLEHSYMLSNSKVDGYITMRKLKLILEFVDTFFKRRRDTVFPSFKVSK